MEHNKVKTVPLGVFVDATKLVSGQDTAMFLLFDLFLFAFSPKFISKIT